jgi:hypothetical protein
MNKSESGALLSALNGYLNQPVNFDPASSYSFGSAVEVWQPKTQEWAVRVSLHGPAGGMKTAALDIIKDMDQWVRGYFIAMTGRPNGGFLLAGIGDALLTIEFR